MEKMTVKGELRKLISTYDVEPTKNTVPGLLGELAVALGGEGTGKNVAEQLHNIAVAKGYTPNPLDALTVDFNIAADEDLFGKVVADLQDNMAVANDAITGTSHYVTEYTGFSSKTDEQQGNYVALHVSVPGMTIGQDGLTVKVNNSALDADGLVVLILKNSTKPIKVVATKGDFSKTIELDRTGIIMESPSVEEEPQGDN